MKMKIRRQISNWEEKFLFNRFWNTLCLLRISIYFMVFYYFIKKYPFFFYFYYVFIWFILGLETCDLYTWGQDCPPGHISSMAPSGSAPVSSGALSQNNPVLEGRPVPEEHTWEAVASPFYCASVVHIPGEIEDPQTLSKLSKLNGFLLHLHLDLWGQIEPGYTQSLQRELDQTPEEFLAVKLDSMLSRERAKFYTRYGY